MLTLKLINYKENIFLGPTDLKLIISTKIESIFFHNTETDVKLIIKPDS